MRKDLNKILHFIELFLIFLSGLSLSIGGVFLYIGKESGIKVNSSLSFLFFPIIFLIPLTIIYSFWLNHRNFSIIFFIFWLILINLFIASSVTGASFLFLVFIWSLWYFLHRKWEKSIEKIPYWKKGLEICLGIVLFLGIYFIGKYFANLTYGYNGYVQGDFHRLMYDRLKDLYLPEEISIPFPFPLSTIICFIIEVLGRRDVIALIISIFSWVLFLLLIERFVDSWRKEDEKVRKEKIWFLATTLIILTFISFNRLNRMIIFIISTFVK